MFDSIRRYFEKRNKEIEAEEYREGFEWAMGEYLIAKKSIPQIEDQFERRDRFDDGALDALILLEKIEGFGIDIRAFNNCDRLPFQKD